jgi:hypothetical protein
VSQRSPDIRCRGQLDETIFGVGEQINAAPTG